MGRYIKGMSSILRFKPGNTGSRFLSYKFWVWARTLSGETWIFNYSVSCVFHTVYVYFNDFQNINYV